MPSVDLTNDQTITDVSALATLAAQTVIDANVDTILAEVVEIELHIHNRERWWGAVGAPDATNAIDANVDTPFSVDSGNDDWGVAMVILGSADNPVQAGDTLFDSRRILVTDTGHATPYRIRLIYGNAGSAAAIAAGQWTETMFITSSGPFLSGTPVDITTPRVAVGWNLWVQVWNATNSSNVLFFWGAHGYVS